MARVDYYVIEQEIQRILQDELIGVTITVETDQPMDSHPWVSVYLMSREAPSGQPIAAGTQTRFRLRFSVWCWCWSLESSEAAAKLRDGLLGDVEIALMKHRKLGNMVLSSWLEGGEMSVTNYQDDAGVTAYVSGGEVVLVAEVLAAI